MLEEFKLNNVPGTCYYIPNFITEAEEKLLLHDIDKTPHVNWTQLKRRRLINYGGHPTQKGMIAEAIPNHIQKYVDKINDLNILGDKKANHVLLNEYKAGEGILSHFDGPLFFPTICTISIGSHTILEFNKPPKDDDNYENVIEFKLLIEPRSLVIFKDDLYTSFMHSIREIKEDDLSDELIKNLSKTTYADSDTKIIERSTRVSLTIRHVPNTSKLKLKFGK